MRIAFFGGTFDPPHCGHLTIARAARERLSLDRVLMAPVATQPLKRDAAPTSSFEDRLEMVRLAVAGEEWIEPSLIDAPRADGRMNYTFESLAELRQKLAPEDSLYCLIGADSFLSLKKWHRSSELLLLADFVVAGRPGFALEDVGSALPDAVDAIEAPARAGPGLLKLELSSNSGHRSNLYLMPDLQVEVSATQIRAALAAGTAAQSLLTPAVVEYIRAHGLYGSLGI